ncbi:MucR family transcriptional regulator [Asticcacaulis sp. DXS10W]|uniref:MucR family transcriptional regulator n=1 Tax=Asticcacaulis currens TaxID=2984210 RepID=A0ABT5IDU2_9CAUL|nr:MucR family transcriptional regulator [Asticcacaulis currens]MDC7694367.1 MucR family transcriptional regulator [Asticcacaulis currens]
MVVEIVSAYVGHNQVPSTEVPQLIQSVHTALTGLSAPSTPKVVAQAPAVSVKKSVTPDYLICLEDGRRFKSLKRHLSTHYNLSPDEYRAKWNMPEDYPMVAPSYAAARSQLAKANGLGQSARNKPKARTRGASGKLRVKY